MSAFGSYRAYEYSESVEFCGTTCHSVMKPEHVAFQATSHARIRCVDCHVGHGAESYARSKLNGARQLYSLAFNKYSKPINTPVHNMRPANETCEQCHWPSKFYGAQLKTFNHYAYDEKNSLRQTRMLINVGGGNPESWTSRRHSLAHESRQRDFLHCDGQPSAGDSLDSREGPAGKRH